MRSHYKTLGVSLDASEADIKKAYRALALKHHPDRGGEESKFKELSAAYTAVMKGVKNSQGSDGMPRRRRSEDRTNPNSSQDSWWNQFRAPADGFDEHSDIYVYPEQLAARIKQRFSYCRTRVGRGEQINLLITIPQGMIFGKTMRIIGGGGYGINGGKQGDLYLTFREKRHASKAE